ncbi:MAG: potassium channel family protein, partial [Gemmatimonadaceae bacterium]
MTGQPVLVIGGGHLAERIRQVASSRGHTVRQSQYDDLRAESPGASAFDAITSALQRLDLASLGCIFLVDDRDEHNFALLVALTGTRGCGRIVAALFNENIAPHLQAANPNIAILNPARIAAPTFVAALDTPVTHELRYTPARIISAPSLARPDRLIRRLTGCFAVLVAVAVIFFHFAEHLSWINALYFVIVTIATVGYGDITLLNSGTITKLVGIALILSSTAFIWMIFSLTVDRLIRRRAELSLGRKKYGMKGHV